MAYNPQLASKLLCLPFEILDRIYDAYLAFGPDDFHNTLQPLHVYLGAATGAEYMRPLPPLMLTCKRVYAELRARVHTEAAAKVYLDQFSSRLGFAVHGTLRYARLRRLYWVVAMEHPNWNRWLPVLDEVIARAPGLREVVVDWQPRRAPPPGRSIASWEVAMRRKKEAHFLNLFARLPELEVLRLHGDIPSEWLDALREITSARVVISREKWWRDPGRLW